MEHLPQFSGSCTLRNRDTLPDAPGIYFARDDIGNVLYVGQAQNLRKRWAGRSHHRYQQLARRGLDKIHLCYIEADASQLDDLERQYIRQLKPVQNHTRVRQSLPKTSPKLSELRRLLNLANAPLFPESTTKWVNGAIVPREPWDLIRGFIAGIDETPDIPHVVVICQQNMGELLFNASQHRTKKRFCTYLKETDCYAVNVRQVIFTFAELFNENSDGVFKAVYPHLRDCQTFGATVKKLTAFDGLEAALSDHLKSNPNSTASLTARYLIDACDRLTLLPDDFKFDENRAW